MFTRANCAYCILWERQIGPVYGKTVEATVAPLRKIDLDQAAADRPRLDPPVTITPTFVLVEGEKEIGRFHGYSDDLTFWSVLTTHIRKLNSASPNETHKTN